MRIKEIVKKKVKRSTHLLHDDQQLTCLAESQNIIYQTKLLNHRIISGDPLHSNPFPLTYSIVWHSSESSTCRIFKVFKFGRIWPNLIESHFPSFFSSVSLVSSPFCSLNPNHLGLIHALKMWAVTLSLAPSLPQSTTKEDWVTYYCSHKEREKYKLTKAQPQRNGSSPAPLTV